MSLPYDTEIEAAAHEKAIDALISETRLPSQAVRTVYEREYERLKPSTRVKDYLLVLTVRRTKEALRHFMA